MRHPELFRQHFLVEPTMRFTRQLQDMHQLLLFIFIGWSIQQSVLLLIYIYTTGLYFSHFMGRPAKTSNKKKKTEKQRAKIRFYIQGSLHLPPVPTLSPTYFVLSIAEKAKHLLSFFNPWVQCQGLESPGRTRRHQTQDIQLNFSAPQSPHHSGHFPPPFGHWFHPSPATNPKRTNDSPWTLCAAGFM